jgi:hypothetical protein
MICYCWMRAAGVAADPFGAQPQGLRDSTVVLLLLAGFEQLELQQILQELSHKAPYAAPYT